MPRIDEQTPSCATSTERLGMWLKSDVTFTLPGWALALGGAGALVLVLVALD
ncbi:hypothetical protein [Roseicyclus mahoneyensis]|uniref:Uncharacterized protein n=1 Tax=Roseicyclus mahoneyensis TaxID=164332 RepID=A0A316GHS4_9RHOB|nr:hypothetical protein [Roseicyclus mahoneyensis]PWK59721.1 hypothetical protein C7455_1066 [Roseicyclus mahoneyensis]